ncbi:ABC-2 type transporter-domain-containing protein [Cercophora newfieldiana]|uniref:ABC-2 type transporter-domain-containing protein n=1 Tax=Cercophora newfieldiana TaxID=92897 RepID=A0AA40CJT6_9PEZI|nr:ABC-2 type transporter-domain-containing protein [Cercophora newfieldiana]
MESETVSIDHGQPLDSNIVDTEANNQKAWALKHRVEAIRERDDLSGLPPRELGVTWKDLTVKAVAADAAIHENAISQFNILRNIREARHKPPMKAILDRSHGCVKPGEMLLVLGRPGSGCTTLLSVLANKRAGYASVDGQVHYGSMDAKEAQRYRGQIIMNTEEELFFPTLTVGQTMDFATRLKIPFKLPAGVTSEEELQIETRDFLLHAMGIEHTENTMVGNEFVRGVSGGERKRVSIIECLATRGSVYCWDNSTRGLDASTALDWAKSLRAFTDILGLSTIVTLYQAGNGIYELFDKVLLLDIGKEVFYGPLNEARPFMEGLGFVCREGSNVADYLTGALVPTERLIRPSYEKRFPRNADALRSEYEASDISKRMASEYDYPTTDIAKQRTAAFQELLAIEKHKHLPDNSPLTVGFATQVKAAIDRQYQIIWGNKPTFFIKQFVTLFQALVAGSLFYTHADDMNSGILFGRSGALFFSLLQNSLMAMSEVTDSFFGRPILLKHKSFSLFHPAAFCIAQIAADIPIILVQVIVFALPLYFMAGLTVSAGAFFTYFALLFVITMVMTAFFRAVGAAFPNFDAASKVSGFMVGALIMYTGFMIQRPSMHPWLGWIFWIDPLAYAFDALLSNEFHNKVIPCVGPNLVPNGPGYAGNGHQACAGVGGAIPGEAVVMGDDYLASLSYHHSHVWRNFGILWAWWLLFVAITMVATSKWRSVSESGPSLLIPREKAKLVRALVTDEESLVDEKRCESSNGDETAVESDVAPTIVGEKAEQSLLRNTSIFTWKDLTYTVKTPTGDRTLLDNVRGWVKPGMLGALMGASGAGKTTLLDVLAQRKTEGRITGTVLVDGRPLPVSFQRCAAYCEQLDVHEPYTTVREALEFSALLRQSRDTPRHEKLAYVDTIIDLLELHDLADTLVGRVGAGLSVEQRKRLTIAVELVAKPSILTFLDEPTSGLDGQSAFNTMRFLRKLADAGQTVLVTIHQPSAQLFAQFDTLLLLARGGKMVYFGNIGDGARTIKDYFARHGFPCPKDANPAEHMIDVVSGSLGKSRDWHEVWMASPEHDIVEKELDRLVEEAASKPSTALDDGHEFATSLWQQIKIVTHRANIALFRNTGYTTNKLALHIGSALFNGFSFWMIGDKISDLQLKMFTVFQFIFVAPGVIAQLQPLFIERRDIFETRERKSKMYSWIAFVTGLVVSEIPYLMICGVLYFVCWYYTVGFPTDSHRAGATLFVMLFYELIYTGIGQSIAAYSPNAVFASLVNPLLIGTLVAMCGVLVPYAQLQPFWRYWFYWLNIFNYMIGSMLVFDVWGSEVNCAEGEFARFNPPNGTTCGEYLAGYLQGMGASSNLVNPDALADCKVCQYTTGNDYLRGLNLNEYYYGWRNAGIVLIFAISSYLCVFLLMKLRTKTSKKAE